MTLLKEVKLFHKIFLGNLCQKLSPLFISAPNPVSCLLAPTLQSRKSCISCLTMATLMQQGKNELGGYPLSLTSLRSLAGSSCISLNFLAIQTSRMISTLLTTIVTVHGYVQSGFENHHLNQLLWNFNMGVNSLSIFPTLKRRMINVKNLSKTHEAHPRSPTT